MSDSIEEWIDKKAITMMNGIDDVRAVPVKKLRELLKTHALVLKEQAGWVSVEDRLPKAFDEVLIYPRPDYGYEILTAEWNSVEGFFYASVYGQYQDTFEKLENVTHWMELKEAPQANEKGE